MSQGLLVLVFCSDLGVFEYSHERLQKNNAPLSRLARAFSRSVNAVRSNWRYTSGGSAFWCFLGGSALLYPLFCLCIIRCVVPDSFRRGSFLPLFEIVVATLSMVLLAVSPLMESIFEKVPFLRASMKAHKIRD